LTILFAYVFILITVIFKFISQGSTATQLRCGGIFNYRVIANFPENLFSETWPK